MVSVSTHPGADHCTRSSEPLAWQVYGADQCGQHCALSPGSGCSSGPGSSGGHIGACRSMPLTEGWGAGRQGLTVREGEVIPKRFLPSSSFP